MPSKAIHSVALSLPVLFLKERRTYIAYTPALDLSASGSTPALAQKNFGVTLRLFLEELLSHGTLDRVLRDMGWSKHESRWQPPVEVQRSSQVPFQMPVAA